MDKIKVYRFTQYKVLQDLQPPLRRWAAKEWIERNICAIVDGSEVEAPARMVDPVGLTIGNYDPHSQMWDEEGNSTFQRQVPRTLPES